MPRLLSPPIVRRAASAQTNSTQRPGRKVPRVSRKPSAAAETRPKIFSRERLDDDSDEKDFVRTPFAAAKTLSPKKALSEWSGKRRRPTPRKPSEMGHDVAVARSFTGLHRAVVRNFKAPRNGRAELSDDNIKKEILASVEDLLDDRLPVRSSEEMYQMAGNLVSCGNCRAAEVRKFMIDSVGKLAEARLREVFERFLEDDQVSSTCATLLGIWNKYRRQANILCASLAPLNSPGSSDASSNIRVALLTVFAQSLSPVRKKMTDDTLMLLYDVRSTATLDGDYIRVLRATGQMFSDTDPSFHGTYCDLFLSSLEEYYWPLLASKLQQDLADYVHCFANAFVFEESLLTEILPAVKTARYLRRFILHVAKCMEEMDQVSLESFPVEMKCDFGVLMRAAGKFIRENSICFGLSRILALYCKERIRSILITETSDKIPRMLLDLDYYFEKLKKQFLEQIPEQGTVLQERLPEGPFTLLPVVDATKLQSTAASFAEFVAARAWSKECQFIPAEARAVARILARLKEIDVFESRLRCVAASHFVQHDYDAELRTDYLYALQGALESKFPTDWTNFNSLLRELELSKSFSRDFHTSRPNRRPVLTVSVLKASTVINCFTPVPLNLPAEIAMDVTAFHEFYGKMAHKKLSWLSGAGSCVLTGIHVGYYGHVSIRATLPQGVILLVFNQISSPTLEDLKNLTGLEDGDFNKALSQMKGLVKVSSNGRYVLEEKEEVRQRKINLLVPCERRSQSTTENNTPKRKVRGEFLERKDRLDCALVRIVKARRSISEDELWDAVKSAVTFAAETKDIEARVEFLVGKEILIRRPGTVDYVP